MFEWLKLKLAEKEDRRLRAGIVEAAIRGFWAVDPKGFPIYVRFDDRLGYMQSMEEHVVPLVFTKLGWDDEEKSLQAFSVSNYDPKVILFRKEGDTVYVDKDPKWRGGRGYAYYSDDATPRDRDDKVRFAIMHEALTEYLEKRDTLHFMKIAGGNKVLI